MSHIPLAEKLRPNTLQEVVGQRHLLAEGATLANLLKLKKLPSIIFWGPPGVGKTTIARLIAQSLQRPFYTLSAIQSGVKDLRQIFIEAENKQGTILFIDEIHRFNKGQQDSLLNAIEIGLITLIGATTENPSFEINNALLSRCQILVLKSLNKQELEDILTKLINYPEHLKNYSIKLLETEALLAISSGDVRKLINAFEIIINQFSYGSTIEITNHLVEKIIKKNIIEFDKKGEFHYDIISAFIKSLRGSDPNASIYWLARMIHSGEDLSFIARRLIIFASEDIGLANPNAALLCQACFDSVERVGYPESRIILANCVIYLACSVKSNSAYLAIEKALTDLEKTGNLPVPLHLRNAPTSLLKNLNYGKNYQYPHNFPDNFVQQHYLPTELENVKYYEPQNNSKENELNRFLAKKWTTKYKYNL